MRFSFLTFFSKFSIHVSRERLVLTLFVFTSVLSIAAIAVDAILFFRYYRVATELPAVPPQARVDIKQDQFEKAVELIRGRLSK